MIAIYKYPIIAESFQTIIMPINAKILSVKEQYGEIVLYALVDRNIKGIEEVGILVLGTGHEVREEALEGYNFIDTVILMDGQLMFHVFYKQSDI